MSSVLPTLLNLLQEIGYPALWGIVFVAAAGIPLPIGLTLLAAGYFAALGEFNVALLALVAFSASVCGDNLGYFVGRKWGSRVLDWIEQPRRYALISPRVVALSRSRFKLQGGWAVFLSRFLFSALGGTINLLAGADPYPYRHFFLFDAAGEAIGVCLPLVLGYAFGASWEEVGALLGDFSRLALTFLILIVLTIYFIHMVRKVRMVRMVRGIRATRVVQARAKEEETSLVEAAVPRIKTGQSGSGNLPP